MDLRCVALEVHVAAHAWPKALEQLEAKAPGIYSAVRGITPEQRLVDDQPVDVAYRFTVYGAQIDELIKALPKADAKRVAALRQAVVGE